MKELVITQVSNPLGTLILLFVSLGLYDTPRAYAMPFTSATQQSDPQTRINQKSLTCSGPEATIQNENTIAREGGPKENTS